MDLANRPLNYQTRLFFLIIIFTWILTFSFFTIQYTREREYKVETLNNKLQLLNMQIINGLQKGESVDNMLQTINIIPKDDSLRVTIINLQGNVKFDTNSDSIHSNHSNRKEIKDAKLYGNGFTVRRQSQTDKNDYFYSATKGDSIIVRTAVPYTHSLVETLRIDTIYIWIIILIALSLTIIAFFATRRIGKSIKYLRDFAREAETGTINNYDTSSFPNDELGDISSHIINMYKNLELITRERDESLNKLLFEEKEKARIKHQMTNNINHELKTPVHSIQACLETMITNRDVLDKEQIIKLAESSYKNVTRLCSLMHDITTITNMSDNAENIVKTRVKIKSILEEIKYEISLLPIEKQMRLNIDVADDIAVTGNKGLIESIFRNLINNAIEYSGGRDINVTVKSENDDYYVFDVWDNGIGVAPEHLSKLFERFYRIDDGRSRKLGGTGLGLSIVKNSVLFHGGTITVENKLHDGLDFKFTLHK
ncbi:MAG: ATP-binding protein [Muribaculaceae bacterium]|nr:ATP-binding protein [Muribaculaceae bacterium]